MARKKNRRRERRHVLDVKLASNQVHRRRVQLAISTLLATVFLLGTVYGLWRGGFWAVQRFVYKNEHLQIQNFEIQTDGVIEKRHLERWAGVKKGANLFAIDLHSIKRELEQQGMIRQASFERVLPDTLKLRVHERVPVARVRVRSNTPDGRLIAHEFGVDPTGRVIPLDPRVVRRETAEAWLQMPLLVGIPVREIVPGRKLLDPQVHAAIRLVREYGQAAIARRLQLDAIDVSPRETLQVTTRQGPKVSVLSIAPAGYARQLARWNLVHAEAVMRREAYSHINLATTNHVAVTLASLPDSSSTRSSSNP